MKHYNVVAAVVIEGEKILCVRKGETRYAYTSHKWEFPGGKIEQGETPQQALQRELWEEMNLKIAVGEELLMVNHTYPDFSITMQAFICTAVSKSFTLKEHEDYSWATLEELTLLDWCEADKPIVEAIVNKRNNISN